MHWLDPKGNHRHHQYHTRQTATPRPPPPLGFRVDEEAALRWRRQQQHEDAAHAAKTRLIKWKKIHRYSYGTQTQTKTTPSKKKKK